MITLVRTTDTRRVLPTDEDMAIWLRVVNRFMCEDVRVSAGYIHRAHMSDRADAERMLFLVSEYEEKRIPPTST